ncbi:MAG: PAS domain-containing sensor histidine kinase [Phycisphaeraceae bacterium]
MLYIDRQLVPVGLFDRLFDVLSAHCAVIDEAGIIVAVNEAWSRFARDSGTDPETVSVGVNYLETCRRAERESPAARRALHGIEAVLQSERDVFQMDYICPGYGRSNWFTMQVFAVPLNGRRLACVAHVDITRRKIVEAEQMAEIEHAERKRLAAQLHDHLQQLLVAAGLPLGSQDLRQLAPNRRKKLDQVRHYLDEAISATRSLSSELRPPALDEQGLPEALHKLGEQHEKLYHVPVTFEITPPQIDLPAPLAAFIYHAVREMLFNAIKHADPTQQKVTLRQDYTTVNVTVTDDGCGCDPKRILNAADGNEGTGLATIRHRLYYFGGDMSVDTAPDQGTTISFHVPLHTADVLNESPR